MGGVVARGYEGEAAYILGYVCTRRISRALLSPFIVGQTNHNPTMAPRR